VDHSPIEVYVVPGELAELSGAQAEGDRDDEQRLEPAVGLVQARDRHLRPEPARGNAAGNRHHAFVQGDSFLFGRDAWLLCAGIRAMDDSQELRGFRL
jgi:hypothetical protein